MGSRTGSSPRARRACVAVVAMLLAALCSGSPAAAAKPRSRHAHGSPQAGGNVALFNREAYYYTSSLSLAQEARRYSVLVLQAPFGRLVRTLHRYNPHLQVYLYQYMMYARADDPQGLELCTSLPTVQAHNWYLRGTDGQPLRNGNQYVVDFGLHAFQQSCAAHAIALAKQYGFNGVFLDGVDAVAKYEFSNASVQVPKYPTQTKWMAAMASFLRTMTGAVHARHLKVVANIGGTQGPQAWQQWSTILDGSEEESFTDGGYGVGQQVPWWTEKLHNAAWAQARGKNVLLHSYNNTEAGNVFGLASMLLIANGRASYSTSNPNVLGSEVWYPEYTTAQHLGRPLGKYRKLRNGVYERKFAHGLVLVNPTTQAKGRLRLHGSYSGSGLSHATAVSLGPTTGLILHRG